MRILRKVTSLILAVILAGNILNFALKPKVAAAESPNLVAEFIPLPQQNFVAAHFLNAGNSGFRVKVNLADGYVPTALGLFLDDLTLLDEQTSFDVGSIELSSGTSTLDQLKDKLSYVPGAANSHAVSLKVKDAEHPAYADALWSWEFAADFELPSGTFEASAQHAPRIGPVVAQGGLYGIGDSLTFTFTPDQAGEQMSEVQAHFNGRALSFLPTGMGNYSAAEVILTDDPASSGQLTLSGIMVEDQAGNRYRAQSVQLATDFYIDATAPTVVIDSPEQDKSYNDHNILVDYRIEGAIGSQVLLDGVAENIAPSSYLSVESDGRHEFALKAWDAAGNLTIGMVNFTLDTAAPELVVIIHPDGGQVTQGERVVFAGRSEPGAQVLLEVYSDAQTALTTVGTDGSWRIEFDSSNLAVGTHESYLTATDLSGNSVKSKIAEFEVVAPAASESERSRVVLAVYGSASTPDAAASECEGTTCAADVSDLGLANESQVDSTQAEQTDGVNWSMWIVFLAIIVLVSALATAGYYGYEWVVSLSSLTISRRAAQGQKARQIKAQRLKKLREIEEKPSAEEEPPERPRTRW